MDEKLKSHFLNIFCMTAADDNVDPRELETMFSIGEKDYGLTKQEIEEAIVKGIDKTSDDTGLGRRLNGYFEQIKTKGLAALGNTPDEINKKVRELAEQYTPIFEAQTTYGIDPDKPMASSTDFIEKTIHRLADSDKDINYREDILGREAREAGRKPKKI